MKNKLLTITAAILLVLGFGAGIASAHHPVIQGSRSQRRLDKGLSDIRKDIR